MRIGLLAPITHNIPPKGYGSWEKVVSNLAQGLVKAGQKEVTIIGTKAAHIEGARTVAVIDRPLGDSAPANAAELLRQHIQFAGEFAKNNLDILHNHLNYLPLDMLAELEIPIVTTLHGAAVEPTARERFLHHVKFPYVSISNSERRLLPELNYVATVYNGINFEEFFLHPKRGRYLVNAAGRIHPTKGVHNAIALAKAVGWPLKIAGMIQPEQQGYFDQQIKPHIDGELIQYLGPLNTTDVSELVGQATAAVGLIEWEEPFGLSVAEAIASGTPVIGTPRGANEEIIIDGQTGIIAPDLEEAIRRFPELLSIDRQNCRQVGRELFSLEKMTSGYLEVYEQLLSGQIEI